MTITKCSNLGLEKQIFKCGFRNPKKAMPITNLNYFHSKNIWIQTNKSLYIKDNSFSPG